MKKYNVVSVRLCLAGLMAALLGAVAIDDQKCYAETAVAPAVRKAKLIAPSTGSLPSDVTRVDASLDESKELGQVALKATFEKGGYFGDYNLKIKDWRPFTYLRFKTFNPDKKPQSLNITIKHAGTTGYPTRFEQNILLRPGVSQQEIPLTGLANNDGSAADLSVVKMLTISLPQGGLVYFVDFTLETGD